MRRGCSNRAPARCPTRRRWEAAGLADFRLAAAKRVRSVTPCYSSDNKVTKRFSAKRRNSRELRWLKRDQAGYDVMVRRRRRGSGFSRTWAW